MSEQDITITERPLDQADAAGGCCGGGCCGGSATTTGTPETQSGSDTGFTARYGVVGMTCGHCVGAVTQELSALAGVTSVEVDLVAGGTSTVTVTSDTPLGEDDVRAAVDEAGYDLAAPQA